MKTRALLSTAQYPMRVVVRRTGLSASLLRAWERRYEAVVPGRSDGGQRLYSEADIRRLNLLKDLVDLGHTIGQIAGRSEEELRTLLLREQGAEGPADAESTDGPTGEVEPEEIGDPSSSGVNPWVVSNDGPERADSAVMEGLVESAVEAVRGMETDRLERLLNRAAVTLTPDQLTDVLLVPLLQHIGTLWERGELGPASEHLASGVIRRFLDALLVRLAREDGGELLLIGTPSGQRHEFGALLAGIVGAVEGWRVIPLGADLPAAEIAEAVRRKGAGAVALSALQPNGAEGVQTELQALSDELAGQVPILVGGPAVNGSRRQLEAAGVICLQDLQELRIHLRKWSKGMASGSD